MKNTLVNSNKVLNTTMRNSFLFILFIFPHLLFSQAKSKKSIEALRIEKAAKIDGILNEPFWLQAQEAKDFVMFRPGDGDKEKQHKTIVKIAYTNEAIYIGATMYDPNPNTIARQFTSRDNVGISDFFLISINPNNDGLNDTEFIITSAGTQADAKVTSNGEDFSWSAVWDNAVKFNSNGWVVEVKIPYSALRFSNSDIQTWGVNFHRKIQSTNEQFCWNYIDKKLGRITQFNGEITGIKNIHPPLRLSFSPYASTSYTTKDGSSDFDYSYGMDVKYGITESFTLDATLIPDFGQTAFDDVVLNLGPHEQRYSEKRAFFTEGTDLFNKGGLFYSRRIGNRPIGYQNVEDKLAENEEIINNPNKVDMLNAIKLSGRTKGNLGIGVFNAITEKTSAKIKNKSTNEIREIITEPFANYNVLVLDQQFNKTSSVSLINTNVLREGHFRDANVTGLLIDIYDKSNTYNADGSFKVSNIRENGKNTSGFVGDLSLGKTSGNHRYLAGVTIANDTYKINDLGFNTRNNFKTFYANYSYRIFEPKGKFDNYGINVWTNLNYLHQPSTYTSSNIGANFWANTKKRNSFGFNFNLNGKQKDFYEPRTDNFSRYFKTNASGNVNAWASTDYRKKFALNLSIGGYTRFGNDNNSSFWFKIKPRYRFSDKFQVNYSFRFSKEFNEKGYVTTLDNNAIIFGNRNTKTIINSISSSYNFNTKSSLALSFRHYWYPVQYSKTYYNLSKNGLLNPVSNSTYSKNNDLNYNAWNLDLSYSWEFAPGSQLVALYRNSLYDNNELSRLSFSKNLDELLSNAMTHNFSLKFIYYLDYNQLKTWL